MRFIQFLGCLVCAGLCFACMPRAHIHKTTGLSLKRVLALQNSVRPQSKLAPVSAQDAKIIMDNHAAGHEKSNRRSSRSGSANSNRQVQSSELEVGSRPRATMRRVE